MSRCEKVSLRWHLFLIFFGRYIVNNMTLTYHCHFIDNEKKDINYDTGQKKGNKNILNYQKKRHMNESGL